MRRAVLPDWLHSEGTSVCLVRLRPETFDCSCHGLGHGDRFQLYSSNSTFSLCLNKTHTKGDLHKELSCCPPMIYQPQICFEMQTKEESSIFIPDKGGPSWLYQSSLDFVTTQFHFKIYKTVYNDVAILWTLTHRNKLGNYFLLECDFARCALKRAGQDCGST